MEKSDDTFCVTQRRVLDVIQVVDQQGNNVVEVAIIEITKNTVKLGFRADKSIKYVLIRAIEEGFH